MFKNYLTFHFAENFVRDCQTLEMVEPKKQELSRCSHHMLNAFSQSLNAKAGAQTSKHLFTAIAYLRDCYDLLQEQKIEGDRLWCRFHILQGRFEQLFWDNAQYEDNQLRMLG